MSLVTVGLPVYNGESSLAIALQSLVAQTHENLEIVVADNASTDGTRQIGETFAAKDSRVRVIDSKENRGAAWNFNRVLHLASGNYFMWAAHDDTWHPDFVSAAVAALESDLDAVLCYSHHQQVTSSGDKAGAPHHGVANLDGSARRRWRRALGHWELHAAIYGVMRTGAAHRTRGVLPVLSTDLVFVSEMSVLGRILEVPRVLHFKSVPVQASGYRSRGDALKHAGAVSRGLHLHRVGVVHECVLGLRRLGLPWWRRICLSLDAWAVYVWRRFWLIDFAELIEAVLGTKRYRRIRHPRTRPLSGPDTPRGR